jgi:hypothetical protein
LLPLRAGLVSYLTLLMDRGPGLTPTPITCVW